MIRGGGLGKIVEGKGSTRNRRSAPGQSITEGRPTTDDQSQKVTSLTINHRRPPHHGRSITEGHLPDDQTQVSPPDDQSQKFTFQTINHRRSPLRTINHRGSSPRTINHRRSPPGRSITEGLPSDDQSQKVTPPSRTITHRKSPLGRSIRGHLPEDHSRVTPPPRRSITEGYLSDDHSQKITSQTINHRRSPLPPHHPSGRSTTEGCPPPTRTINQRRSPFRRSLTERHLDDRAYIESRLPDDH